MLFSNFNSFIGFKSNFDDLLFTRIYNNYPNLDLPRMKKEDVVILLDENYPTVESVREVPVPKDIGEINITTTYNNVFYSYILQNYNQ